MRRLSYAFVFALSTLMPIIAMAQSDVSIDPQKTYLRICGLDTGHGTFYITLSTYGVHPGDRLRLQALGAIKVGLGSPYNTDTWRPGLTAVFSSSTLLGATTTLNRVINAINAGNDVVTPDSCVNNGPPDQLTNDISQDFYIAGPSTDMHPDGTDWVIVTVPAGAAYLFVASYDSFWHDNSDPNSDYKLRLYRVCTADFDGDGDVGTDADIEAFWACLSGDCCATCGTADFNGDGDTGTDADIEAFFAALGGNPC